MPRRIILHAGFHKTGTTSIQKFLRANRPALKKQIAVRLKPQLKPVLHAARAYSITGDPDALQSALDAFETVLQTLPAMPRRSLILSAEDLCGHLPGRASLADYARAPDLLYGYVARILDRLPQTEPMLFMTTRSPDSWLQSAYWEHVRSFDLRQDYSDFQAQFGSAADLNAQLDEIAARVPCVTHRIDLADSAHHPFGPADPLLDLAEIPPGTRAKLIRPAHANRTPDIPVMLQLLAANRTYDDTAARRAAKKAILIKARQP